MCIIYIKIVYILISVIKYFKIVSPATLWTNQIK